MEFAKKSSQKQVFADLLAIIFMGAVALAAQTTGFMLLLFPELAALSHDIMTRPYGKWGSQPLRLILTPTLTAIVGIFFTRRLPFGALGIALIVTFSLVIIKVMRSTIVAAISAGVLPMALSERSWRYPLAIFVDCALLVLLFLLWKHYAAPTDPAHRRSRLWDTCVWMRSLPLTWVSRFMALLHTLPLLPTRLAAPFLPQARVSSPLLVRRQADSRRPCSTSSIGSDR